MSNSNRYASQGFRDSVILRMHAAGLYSADVLARDESIAMPVRGKGGLITGLPWTVLARLDRGPTDWSGALDDAAALARHLQSDRFAAVISRHGRDVGETYTVTTLDNFIALLQREYDVEVPA